jgi:hypothetical protein
MMGTKRRVPQRVWPLARDHARIVDAFNCETLGGTETQSRRKSWEYAAPS